MNKEVQAILSLLKEVLLLEIGGKLLYKGEYLENEVIVAQAGIGKVNASIITTTIINEFSPKVIINSGVAGGYAKELQPLDVVIADKLYYYDFDATFGEDDLRYGQVPGEEFFFETAENLRQILIEADLKINYHIGGIITADKFATNRQDLETIVNKYFVNENILAVDMESASIAHTAHSFKIPFIIVRSISDIIGLNQEQIYYDFLERACQNASLIVSSLLEKI